MLSHHSSTPTPHTPPKFPPVHHSSLDHIHNFTLTSPPPSTKESQEADFLFHQIMNQCESQGLFVPNTLPARISSLPTPPPVYLHCLFRALVHFCPQGIGRVNLIRMVLHGLFSSASVATSVDRSFEKILPLARAWYHLPHTDPARQHVFDSLSVIALDFLQGFFVPLTAQASRTPYISRLFSPPSGSHASPAQGTPHRLSALRQLCLLRDNFRCVVSGLIDKDYQAKENSAGRILSGYATTTEAAHIIPHSLNSIASAGDSISPTKSFVWQILNMFDPGVSIHLEGALIDTPSNAMILAHDIHDEFGKLRCYFEEVVDGSREGLLHSNTYRVCKTRNAPTMMPMLEPKAEFITFTNHEPQGTRQVELPSPRLLKLHAACAKMMEMAGAADYVGWVVDDLDRMNDEGTLKYNGSSDFGMVLRMKMGGEKIRTR